MGSEGLSRATAAHIRAGIVRIRHPGSLGTGFFISADMVATCRHVVDGAAPDHLEIEGASGIHTVQRVIVATPDSELDAAILVVRPGEPVVLEIGASRRFGPVYSMGYQFSGRGYEGYPAYGVIAGLAVDTNSRRELIQIDGATITEGLSGAPLHSMSDDRIVGIVKRSRPEGGGYAIPIEQLSELLPEIMQTNARAAARGARSGSELSTYFEQLSKEHEYIALGDLHRRLRLADVYTSLSLSQDGAVSGKLAVQADGRVVRSDSLDFAPRGQRRDRGAPDVMTTAQKVSIFDLLTYSKAVVVGEPGSGKTTLLRHLAARICEGEFARDRLPLFIRLGNLQPAIGSLESGLKLSYPAAATRLLNALSDGQCLLLLDGLDEAPRRHHAFFISEIERLSALGNQVIMTCRSVALPRSLLPSDYKIFDCIGFSPMQQRRFLRQWFGSRLDRALELENQIERNTGVTGFARNPLLLSLMAVVTENESDFRLPVKRTDLYDKALRVLLERRTLEGRTDLTPRKKLIILRDIANHYFANGHELFAEEDLLRRIEQNLREMQWNADPEDVLSDFVKIDGVLTLHSPGRYRFLHLTFQEFLTAQAITSSPRPGELILESMDDPRWEEAIRLVCGLLDATAANEFITALFKAWRRDQVFDRLLLAARACGDSGQLPRSTAIDLATALVAALAETAAPGREPETEQALGDLCRAYAGLTNEILAQAARQGLLHTSAYVRLLGVTADEEAKDVLEHSWRNMTQAADTMSDETLALAGEVCEAIGQAGLVACVDSLVETLDSPRTYLATAAALCLIELLPLDCIPDLESRLHSPNEVAASLSLSVLMSFQSPELTERLFDSLFPGGRATLQAFFAYAFNRGETDLAHDKLIAALDAASSNDTRACLLSLERCYLHPSLLSKALAECFRDDPVPSPACAAATSILRIDPTLTPQLWEAAARHFRSGDPNLIRTILAATSPSWAEQLGRLADHSLLEAEKLALADGLLMFAAENRVRGLQAWVESLLNRSDVSPTLWWRAFCTLSSIGAPTALDHGRKALADLAGHPERAIIVYRAFGALSDERARHYLIEQLEVEKDPAVVAEVLDALGRHRHPDTSASLRALLREANWPAGWPPPEAPRRQGDQRPSDRRYLSIIAGLERSADELSATVLAAFAEDEQQPIYLREAAGAAARQIRSALSYSDT